MKLKSVNLGYSKSFILLSLLFLIISLIQATFTELAYDEAYYWRFSQDLDWGYFDHPPFTAFIIKLGTSIFEGELGVRFFTVIFGYISIFLLWNLLDKKDREKTYAVSIFFMLWFSLPIFNIYTFITVPDSPLLFFALLYIIFLRKFKNKSSLINSLLLGLIMALMLYSKYHGVILILITIIVDFKLLKNRNFYFASIFGALLFLPHLIWQYNHDFPSIRYHLYERNSEFSFKFIIEYPLNVLLILNPFLSILFLIKNFKKNKKSKHDKTMRYIFGGFIIFFGLSTLKGHVEPHWIAISSIPLLVLLFKIGVTEKNSRKLIKLFFIFSTFILIFIRVALIFDFLPVKTEFHKQKDKMVFIKQISENLPVVFISSYKAASIYQFYTNNETFSSNVVWNRKNQYDIWDVEKNYNNKKVFVVSSGNLNNTQKKVFLPTDTIYYNIFENYISAEKLELSTIPEISKLKNDSMYQINLNIKNPNNYNIILDSTSYCIKAYFIIYKRKEYIGAYKIQAKFPNEIKKSSEITLKAYIKFNNIGKGQYQYYISFIQKNLPPLFNSKKHEIEIL